MENLDKKEETETLDVLEFVDTDMKKSLNKLEKVLTLAKEEQEEEKTVDSKKDKIYQDEIVVLIERLHLRILENNIDILYRPNHEYLEFVEKDEDGLNRIKELISMSRDEFATYLNEKTLIRIPTKKQYQDMKKSSLEEWYKGAWAGETKRILDSLNLTNPIEEPIWKEFFLKDEN